VLNNDIYVLATLSIPTFNNSYVLAVDHDILERQLNEQVLSMVRAMGRKDGELMLGMYSTFKPNELYIAQLRGLGRVQVQSMGGSALVKVCRENLTDNFSRVILSYLEGFVEPFSGKVQDQGLEESCLRIRLTVEGGKK
jgi:hypothetical protein